MSRLSRDQLAGRKPIELADGVDDVDQAAMRWVALGAGPFYAERSAPSRAVASMGHSRNRS